MFLGKSRNNCMVELFKFNYIDDYDVVLPTIWITPILKKTGSFFGVEPKVMKPKEQAGEDQADKFVDINLTGGLQSIEGAYKYLSIINDIRDIKNLKKTKLIIDRKKTEERVERIKEIVNELLPVKVIEPQLSASPFEYVCQFRNTEEVLLDFITNPKLIHEMMGFFTSCIVEQFKRMDREGKMYPEYTWDARVHFDKIENNKNTNCLKNCWSYISAQSAGGISPKMYEEFLQPYHARIAELFGKGKIYYHGCEDLTEKFDIIKKLPNLRRFHVSPWSNLEKILDKQQKQFVYEVCVNTTNHLFVFKKNQIVEDLRRLKRIIIDGSVVADINMIDIETVENNPKKLIEWSKIAKDVLEG